MPLENVSFDLGLFLKPVLPSTFRKSKCRLLGVNAAVFPLAGDFRVSAARLTCMVRGIGTHGVSVRLGLPVQGETTTSCLPTAHAFSLPATSGSHWTQGLH